MIRFHDACGTTGKTVAARLLPRLTRFDQKYCEVCKNDHKHTHLPVLGSFKKCDYRSCSKKMRKLVLDIAMFFKTVSKFQMERVLFVKITMTMTHIFHATMYLMLVRSLVATL